MSLDQRQLLNKQSPESERRKDSVVESKDSVGKCPKCSSHKRFMRNSKFLRNEEFQKKNCTLQ